MKKNIKKLFILLMLGLALGLSPFAFAQGDPTFTVTIVKYIDGDHANAENANCASFAMHAVFPGGSGDFTLSTSGFNNPNPYEATTSALAMGSDYSVSETIPTATTASTCDGEHPFALMGYSSGNSLVEAANATTTMSMNLTGLSQNKFVIVWNKACPVNESNGSLIINKKTTGGNATFNFTGTGGISPFQISTANGTGMKLINNLVPGTYSITENNLPGGWSMATTTCDNVTITGNATTTCEISNTFSGGGQDTGSLTVVKKTIGGDNTFYFASNNAGVGNFGITTVAGTGSKTFNNLVPGSYDVDEITSLPLGNGWVETKTTCNDVIVSAGQTATCQIDNKFIPPSAGPFTVTIIKYIDGVPATALITGNRTFNMVSSWNASNIGVGNGSYTLGPIGYNNTNPYYATTSYLSAGADYATSENLPTDCSAGNQYMLSGYSIGDTIGEAASAAQTLTSPNLTNINSNKFIIVWDKTCPTGTGNGRLAVTKKTTGGNATFNFTGTGGISPFQISTANGTGMKLINNLVPGTYSITENNLPGGWSMATTTCDNVTITGNATTTCEISNTFAGSDGGSNQNRGSILIYKKTLGGNGTFNFSGNNGIGNFNIATTNGSGTKTISNLQPGIYSITESNLSNDWSMAGNTCSNIRVDANATTTCAVYNVNQSVKDIHKYNSRGGDYGHRYNTVVAGNVLGAATQRMTLDEINAEIAIIIDMINQLKMQIAALNG